MLCSSKAVLVAFAMDLSRMLLTLKCNLAVLTLISRIRRAAVDSACASSMLSRSSSIKGVAQVSKAISNGF